MKLSHNAIRKRDATLLVFVCHANILAEWRIQNNW